MVIGIKIILFLFCQDHKGRAKELFLKEIYFVEKTTGHRVNPRKAKIVAVSFLDWKLLE